MRGGLILAIAALPLCGCAAAGPAITSLASAGVAGTVGSATGSALAGAVVGLGVAYGVDQGVKYGERQIEDNVQRAVAETAGPLNEGAAARWQVTEKLPFSDRSGTVEVARAFGTAIPCKEVVFTVEGDDDHAVYTTTICRDDRGLWRWALAEPSIHRWGYLQ